MSAVLVNRLFNQDASIASFLLVCLHLQVGKRVHSSITLQSNMYLNSYATRKSPCTMVAFSHGRRDPRVG